MPVAPRNSELVDLLKADFQARKEPNFSWGQVISNFLMLPKLRAFWPYSSVNEAGNLYDLSGQGRIMTSVSAIPFNKSGFVPWAFTDGLADYFTRADEAGLDITSYLSLITWLYPTNVGAGTRGVINKWLSAGNQRSYQIYTGATPIFRVSSTGADTISVVSSKTLTANQWYYIAATYVPSTYLRIWVNPVDSGDYTEQVVGVPAALFNSTSPLDFFRYDGGTFQASGSRMTLTAIMADYLNNIEAWALFEQTRAMFGV